MIHLRSPPNLTTVERQNRKQALVMMSTIIGSFPSVRCFPPPCGEATPATRKLCITDSTVIRMRFILQKHHRKPSTLSFNRQNTKYQLTHYLFLAMKVHAIHAVTHIVLSIFQFNFISLCLRISLF